MNQTGSGSRMIDIGETHPRHLQRGQYCEAEDVASHGNCSCGNLSLSDYALQPRDLTIYPSYHL